MTTNRPVHRTLPAFDVDMGGLKVKQALPTNEVNQIDPFLLLHHTEVPVQEGASALDAGVPPHPHRGFSAVTFVIGGEVHHRDSLGNSSIIGPGGVQWVNAARGIVHSERPSAALAAKGGVMGVIQLWVNSPASQKLAQAAYHALEKQQLPELALADGVKLHLVTGTYSNLEGKIPAPSPMRIARIYAKAGSNFNLDLVAGFNAALYIISGKGSIRGHGPIEEAHLYELSKGTEEIFIDASADMDLLLLSGQPIAESLATYGPFVMNNQTEIMQALRDYQMGKMGVLIEE